MGKSSLLSRLSTSVASRSAIVWEVKSQEIGRNIPFATISDFILALAQYPGAGETDARWLAEAGRVAPGLRTWHSGIPDPPPVPADAVRLRVAEALVRIIQVVGDSGPMLLVLDDLEYLDPASRDILHLLLRRLERSELLVVGSARSAGDQTLVHGELGGSRGLHWDDIITLGPLAPEHVREMVVRLCAPGPVPASAILDTMVELAQGNPYLVEMLLSDWRRQSEESLVSVYRRGADAASRWRPPATMNKAFERQHRGLSAESDRVLSLLAVAGRRLSAQEVGELLALDGAVADAAAMQLLDRGIVRVEEGGLQIKNQLHRSYVYHAMAEDTRRYLHGKVADALSQAEDEAFQDLLEAAHHYVRSANRTRAADTLVAGAETAINRGAPKEASRALVEVGAETGEYRRSDLTLLLAEAFLWQGLHEQALKQVQVVRTTNTDPHVQARANAVGAEAMYRGRLTANAKIGEQAKAALSLAEEANDTSLVVRALQLTAEIAHDAADQETIDNVQAAACSIELTSQSREVLPIAAATRGYCMMINGHHREAAERFSKSVRGLREQRRETELRRALNGLGICLTNIGDLSLATTAFEDALRLAEQAGDPYAQSILWDNLAVIYEDMGQLVDAVDSRRRAYRLSQESPSPKRHCEILTNAALLAAMLGECGQASSYLMESTEIARTLGIPGLLITALIACCDLALTRGEADSAWRWAEEAIALADLHGGAWRPVGDFTRIYLHYTWATRGYRAYREVRETTQARGLSFRLTHQLELEAFHEWVHQNEGAATSASVIVPKLAAKKLFGSILRLASIGICPHGPVSTDQRIPSELRVRSAFPSCRLHLPTVPIDVLQRGA
jgi:tetratricopeptide (TPR) repeat protein